MYRDPLILNGVEMSCRGVIPWPWAQDRAEVVGIVAIRIDLFVYFLT